MGSTKEKMDQIKKKYYEYLETKYKKIAESKPELSKQLLDGLERALQEKNTR